MFTLAAIIILLFAVMLFCVSNFGVSFNWLGEFFDLPTIIVLLLLCLFFLMATGSLKDFGNTVKLMVKRKAGVYTLGELKASQDAVIMLSQAVIYCIVFIAAFLGVDMLYHMDDLAGIGPAIAVMLLSIVYGMLIEMLLLVMKMRLQKTIRNYLKADAGGECPSENMESEKEGEQ